MKITIYELLGLVKDGKAPKKIKYKDNAYYLCKNMVDLHTYQTKESNTTRKLSLIIDNEYLNLNDEVEIIEEPRKIKKIEIYEDEEGHYFLNNRNNKIYIRCDETDFMVDKFNELIDEINKLKEK